MTDISLRISAELGILRGAMKTIAASGPSLADHRNAVEYARFILDQVESLVEAALVVFEEQQVASSLQANSQGEQHGRADA